MEEESSRMAAASQEKVEKNLSSLLLDDNDGDAKGFNDDLSAESKPSEEEKRLLHEQKAKSKEDKQLQKQDDRQEGSSSKIPVRIFTKRPVIPTWEYWSQIVNTKPKPDEQGRNQEQSRNFCGSVGDGNLPVSDFFQGRRRDGYNKYRWGNGNRYENGKTGKDMVKLEVCSFGRNYSRRNRYENGDSGKDMVKLEKNRKEGDGEEKEINQVDDGWFYVGKGGKVHCQNKEDKKNNGAKDWKSDYGRIDDRDNSEVVAVVEVLEGTEKEGLDDSEKAVSEERIDGDDVIDVAECNDSDAKEIDDMGKGVDGNPEEKGANDLGQAVESESSNSVVAEGSDVGSEKGKNYEQSRKKKEKKMAKNAVQTSAKKPGEKEEMSVNTMTYEEYEKVLLEKKKALDSRLNPDDKADVTVDKEPEPMLHEKKECKRPFNIKPKSDNDLSRKVSFDRRSFFKGPTINDFLKSAIDGKTSNSAGNGRGAERPFPVFQNQGERPNVGRGYQAAESSNGHRHEGNRPNYARGRGQAGRGGNHGGRGFPRQQSEAPGPNLGEVSHAPPMLDDMSHFPALG